MHDLSFFLHLAMHWSRLSFAWSSDMLFIAFHCFCSTGSQLYM